MDGLVTLLGCVGGLSALGALERRLHRRAVLSIPTRVHVNGTRGKSSVTRLVAAALRAHGRRTVAKTTGTLARLILPNGRELPVVRRGRANIIEQIGVIRQAAELKAEALVMECMALQPQLQALSERVMVRANVGVITNARADHLDVMGPGEEDVALALAGTVPRKGLLFSAEQRWRSVLERAAQDRGTEARFVGPEAVDAVTDEDLAGFRYVEHRENVALALAVTEHLGVERSVALSGMWSAAPDPGALFEVRVEFFGRQILFVNAFAANDPESTQRIYDMARARHFEYERTIVIVNCRADRPDRSRQLGEVIPAWSPADHYLLIGTGTYLFAREAVRQGIDASRLVSAEGERVDQIFERVVELGAPSALVIGVANIGGDGLELVRFFRNRAHLGKAAES